MRQPPRELSPAAIAAFEAAFGAPWRQSPITTALGWLVPELRRRGGWQSPAELPPAALRGGTERTFIWQRELTDTELAMPYLHVYDKHASFLGVLGGLELGLGTPRRYDRPAFDRRLPGYWRVVCTWPPPDPMFPDPLLRGGSLEEIRAPRWVTTPTVEWALEAGCELDILAGWQWPAHHRVLRGFGERCYAARRALQVAVHDGSGAYRADCPQCAASDALQALKRVYGALLGGFLARLRDRERAPRPPWYRPDWRHAIIAKARANMARNLAFSRPRGLQPLAIVNDAFYCASELADGAQLAQLVGLRLDDSLAGYTHDGCYPLDQVVQERRVSRKLIVERARAEGAA